MAILKAIGSPGSLGFLITVVAVSLFAGYVWPRRRRLGHFTLLLVLAGYLVLAWPPAVRVLLGTLPAPPATRPGEVAPPDVLIVFDGDNRAGRARLADAMYAASPPPKRLQVLGSSLILEHMSSDLLSRYQYAQAATTREQMLWVQQFVEVHPDARVAIIVSRVQAPRVLRLAARTNLSIPILASALDGELAGETWQGFTPSLVALAASRDALYERLALWYYALRRWI